MTITSTTMDDNNCDDAGGGGCVILGCHWVSTFSTRPFMMDDTDPGLGFFCYMNDK